jgi:hypothetical protein
MPRADTATLEGRGTKSGFSSLPPPAAFRPVCSRPRGPDAPRLRNGTCTRATMAPRLAGARRCGEAARLALSAWTGDGAAGSYAGRANGRAYHHARADWPALIGHHLATARRLPVTHHCHLSGARCWEPDDQGTRRPSNSTLPSPAVLRQANASSPPHLALATTPGQRPGEVPRSRFGHRTRTSTCISKPSVRGTRSPAEPPRSPHCNIPLWTLPHCTLKIARTSPLRPAWPGTTTAHQHG